MGRDSSVGIATRYGLDGPEIESRGGVEVFRTRPDRPKGAAQPSIQQVPCLSPGVKRPGRGFDHPPPSSAKAKKRVELYVYSFSGPSLSILGRTVPFTF